MRNKVSKSNVKDWLRVAAKAGLLFTDPKVRSAVGDDLKERMGDVSDSVTNQYDTAASRLDNAVSALQGRSQWPSRVAFLLVGIGVGAGVGILLAPASGRETRESVRDRAIDLKNDLKNRAFDGASSEAASLRRSVTSMHATGTQG
jgi:gas vesicle protein